LSIEKLVFNCLLFLMQKFFDVHGTVEIIDFFLGSSKSFNIDYLI